MTQSTLLDTDVLIEVMKRHPVAFSRASTYVSVHAKLSFSIITRYEILRGLHIHGAPADISRFDQFCSTNDVVPLSNGMVSRAAAIYADLRRRGLLIGDADILIAATAAERGMTLATNNQQHFSRIAGLVIENWLVP